MDDKDYIVAADWAHDQQKTPLADTIICSQDVKEQIVEALKGKTGPVDPPHVKETTIPVKVITVPGIDVNAALLIDVSKFRPKLTGHLNANGDLFSAEVMHNAVKKYEERFPMNNFYISRLPPLSVINKQAVSIGASSGDVRWRPVVRADMGERCNTCENSLICKTEELCPVICAGCSKRYLIHKDVEIRTYQICLGFDWENAKRDYQCDACVPY